jgi:DNA-directed RNA polymerase subunit RPC12/RpoP
MDSPDVNNYQNIIPSGSITMKERDGSPLRKGPIHGIDNLGNEQIMYPGFDYQFPGNEVTETLLAKMGGGLLDKTIKCGNCGWQWKAADGGSDVMDCHKCGGKGLVKAQTGGGLYSDYNLPIAQNGGSKKPIYVESKNDPRYLAYQDSLTAYNYGEKEYTKFLKDRNEHNRYIKEKITIQRPSVDKKDVERLKQTPFPIYENSLAQDRRWAAGRENLEAAQQNKGKLLRITNNKPISVNSIKYTDIKQNDPGVLDILGRIVGVETKADKERSDDGAMYLGNSSYSRYKKPQQPVIVKSTTTKPSTKSKPSTKPQQKEVNVKPQLQPMVEAINLPPMQNQDPSFSKQELDLIRPIQAPKSYNVNMQRYNMQGPSDYYQANEEGVDYERAMQIKAASDAYNKSIEEKYGPQNEYRNSKAAEKAAERLKQLKSEFNVTSNYKFGGDLFYAQNGTETWKKQEQSLKAEKLAKLKKLLEKDEPVFKKKTFDEKIAEKRAQENTKTVQKDNTNVRGYNKADKHSNVARNLTKSELEEKQRYEDEQIAKERQSRIDAQAKANEQPFDWSNFRQSLADRSQATGDALRVSNEPNFFDDYLNPAVMIGSMADNLGQAPIQAQQSDS